MPENGRMFMGDSARLRTGDDRLASIVLEKSRGVQLDALLQHFTASPPREMQVPCGFAVTGRLSPPFRRGIEIGIKPGRKGRHDYFPNRTILTMLRIPRNFFSRLV